MASASQHLMSQHPLQHLPSPSRGVSAVLHILGLCSFSGSYWYLVHWPSPINESYGWHWQYLTIIGLTLATGTFVIGLLADLTLSSRLFLLKNSLSVCSAPLEVLISLLYWGICAIDRKLVVPPDVDIAPFADIGFHLMPALFLAVDLLFLSPPWTVHVLPAMGISFSIAFAYWAWVEHCFSYNGWYPYPLFGILTTPQRVFLFAGAAMTMTASTAMLKWISGRVAGLKGAEKRSTPANIKGE